MILSFARCVQLLVITFILANTPRQISRLAVRDAVQAGLCLPVVTNQTARFSRLISHLQTRQLELIYYMYVNIRHQLLTSLENYIKL